MSIITFILVVVAIGVLMYLVNLYVPMSAPIKNFLNIAVVILLVIWLLSLLGVLPVLDARMPQLGNR